MSYLALYRKYRPKTFDMVVGQEHITTTLKNQITSSQVSHAYLFTGTRGTGKTSIAKIFAQSVNCENPNHGSACGKCDTCKALTQINNIDILEIDAASNNRVDEIRDLREKVKYPPVNGKYKVYIIDEVHMLTESAFNALLKTLEEPPAHVIFVLATTEVQKLPATILSRCLRFDFKLLTTTELEKHLKYIFEDSGVKYEKEALTLISSLGEGSVRDTLSIADMCIAYSNKNVTYNSVLEAVGAIDKSVVFELGNSILSGNSKQVIEILNSLINKGKNPVQIAKEITNYFRSMAVIKTTNEYKDILGLPNDLLKTMEDSSQKYDIEIILAGLKEFSSLDNEFRYTLNPRLVIEVRALTFMQNNNVISDLNKRVELLENQISNQQKKSKNIKVGASVVVDKSYNEISLNENSIINSQFENNYNVLNMTNNKSTNESGLESNVESGLVNGAESNLEVKSESSLVDNAKNNLASDIELENDNNFQNESFESLNITVEAFDDTIENLKFLTPPSEDEITEIMGYDNIDFGEEDNEVFLQGSVNAKSIFGRIMVDLRKNKNFLLHSLMGTINAFKFKNNIFTIYAYDDFKISTLKKSDNYNIIKNIVDKFIEGIEIDVVKLEQKVKNNFNKEEKLKELFGNILTIK